jgi:hypothetical protein
MHLRKLLKGLLLSFALGAILSVASDSAITHQLQALAVAKAQAIAEQSTQAAAENGAKATRAVSTKLQEWASAGVNALVKEVVKQFESPKGAL